MTGVVVSVDGPVCRIRLDRPEKLNALNDEVRRSLTDAYSSLADDTDVRVVVLEGAGRAFSAGADLTAFGGGTGKQTWAQRRHSSGAWQRLLDLMESVPQVTVAGLHGHCVGGAALLAASCDIRVASEDLVVHIPEVAIGIPLTWAGIPRLVREIGLPMARDLVMTGRRIDAVEALRCGFVQRVVPDLGAGTDELIAELLAMPRAPLAMTRSMFAAIGRERLGTTGWADADLLAWSLREPEGQQAAADYVGKRFKRD